MAGSRYPSQDDGDSGRHTRIRHSGRDAGIQARDGNPGMPCAGEMTLVTSVEALRIATPILTKPAIQTSSPPPHGRASMAAWVSR